MTNARNQTRNAATLAASLLATALFILAAPPATGQSSSEEESGSSTDLGSYSVGAPGSRSNLDSDIEEMDRPELDRGSFQLNQNDMALDPDYGSSGMDLELDINPSRAEDREERRAVENERRVSDRELEADNGNLEDQDVRPIRVDAPRYPGRAHRRGTEGFATVEFVVDTRGRTRDVRVVDSGPGSVFDAPAREAVRNWEFEPRIVDGRPVSTELRQTIEFSRDD